jgi:hypothetical protein
MQLLLTRQFAIDDATIGVLTVDGAFQCFTLEDVVRADKIRGKTAIPTGAYDIALCESPRFSDSYEKRGLGRIVPLLINVPNYKGVRIHIGNKAADTDGCILVGNWRKALGGKIENSTKTYKALLALLLASKTPARLTIASSVTKLDDKMRQPSNDLYKGLFGMGQTVPA